METYKKPIYNPFQDLNPPVGMIKEVVKSLKQQAYATQRESQDWTNQGWPVPSSITERHKKLNSRIKDYQYRLSTWSKGGGWGNNNGSSIGDVEIRRAKEVPIANLFSGVLHRKGKTLVGICPFHSEKTPSFTIFTDSNRWHCFGCNTGGDGVDLIQLRDGVGFVEAVKYLILERL